MKRAMIATVAVLMMISVLPQPAHAGLGVFATWWDGNDTDNGFGGGLKYEVPLIPIVSLDFRASYISFGDKDLYTIPFEATGTMKLGPLYGGAALGYYIWASSSDLTDLSAKDKVGGSILVGASLGLGAIGAFGELRYNFVKTEIEGIDTKADGVSINLGVTF